MDREESTKLCNQLLELLELPEKEEWEVARYVEEHSVGLLLNDYPVLNLSEDTKVKIGTIAELSNYGRRV